MTDLTRLSEKVSIAVSEKAFVASHTRRVFSLGEGLCATLYENQGAADFFHGQLKKLHAAVRVPEPKVLVPFVFFGEKKYAPVMEYISGLTLGEYVAGKKRLPLPVWQQLAEGIDKLKNAGFVIIDNALNRNVLVSEGALFFVDPEAYKSSAQLSWFARCWYCARTAVERSYYHALVK